MTTKAMLPALVVGMLAWMASAPSAAQNVEPPQLKPGDTWTYQWSGSATRTETRVVKEVTADRYRIAQADVGGAEKAATTDDKERGFWMTRDLNTVLRDPQNPDKPQIWKWFEWPLEPGKSWSFPNNAGANAFNWAVKVQGWETVTVPAGTFKALKLALTRSGGQRPASEEAWYAPEAKGFVKRTMTYATGARSNVFDQTTIELTAYKLN